MNKDLLIERIEKLCKQKGVNMTTAFTSSGVGKNFRSNLKTADPSEKNLSLLAKYFNVSVEYLLGEEDEEALIRRAIEVVIEWLTDNDYSVEEEENDTYSIGKDGQYIYLSHSDLARESLRIKAAAQEGFELAMLSWQQKQFPAAVHIERSNNHLFNAINESPNATLNISGAKGFSQQELELVDMFRGFSLEKQLKLLTYAFQLKENK